MQSIVGLMHHLGALPGNLSPRQYVTSLVAKMAHEEAQTRLSILHRGGFRSAHYDRPRFTIVFRDPSELEKYCSQVGEQPENVTRRYLELAPSGWDELVNKMISDRDVGVFSIFIVSEAERRRLRSVPVKMGECELLNAGAMPVPSGGECILLNSGIAYSGDLAALLYLFGSEDGSALTKQQMAQAMAGFLAVARHATVGERDFGTVAMGVKAAREIRKESELDTRGTIMKMFILLHEYGHVVLGHVDLIRNVDFRRLSDWERRSFLRTMRDCEFEADRWAFERMLAADWSACAFERDPDGRITCVVSVFLVFQLFRFAAAFSKDVDPELSTHPPATERAEAFLGHCRSLGIPPEFEGQIDLISKYTTLCSTMKHEVIKKGYQS